MLEERIASLLLVDHHCHGVVRRDLDRPGFESLLTEAEEPGGPGGSLFDSRIGFAVRRWCAPVLDLPAHADPDEYLARRAELGAAEVNRRFLQAAGLEALCVDTGHLPEALLDPAELGGLAKADAYEVLRLERLAEEVAADGVSASAFAAEVRSRLAVRAPHVVGFKSVAAYRAGLELAGERPSDGEVAKAAGRLLRDAERGLAGCDAPPRVHDEVLHRFLVWCASDLGGPVQFHVGYGDADADLRRGDPLLLTGLLRELARRGTPVMLLHNYPFHRNAGYLAQVFPNVFVDVGLAAHNLGDRAPVILAELMELAPFGKVLYSSDAYGLPELFHLGALLFRRGLTRILGDGVAEGSWTERDAARIAELIGSGNARRVYRLGERT
ncbi:amidohydrolase [Actinomadura rubrobrunea]|uniref:Amidohydrolase n=1 Tax=Actinomadura rubrobrunea TaxID=115335 RepID=A0A9W6PZ55_9ACTN|nr:amidohydrolase family protein [Actinomadura rubrobrunea]GLW66547.1 amidohydrolase [Actinomadura rubrobrunea]